MDNLQEAKIEFTGKCEQIWETEAAELGKKIERLMAEKNSYTISTIYGLFIDYLEKKYPGGKADFTRIINEQAGERLDYRYCYLLHKLKGSGYEECTFLDFPGEDSIKNFVDKLESAPILSVDECGFAENLKNEYLILMEKKGASDIYQKTEEFLTSLREKHNDYVKCLLCGILWNTISGDKFTIPTFYDFKGEESIRAFIEKLKEMPDKKK